MIFAVLIHHFSYILNSTILKCAKGETVLGIKAFATTLQQYKETDLIVYQQDRSLRPPRRKKNTLTRFMPNPEQLEFYKIKQDINRENMENTARYYQNLLFQRKTDKS